ncbi:unnamed protein product [Prorocentrum cordatum]|uniref:RRM domain-containing protein n=1 Tax=Prorocentrum cordatum TaxID=2364126 RepID=A0ABN9R485_9DINO|nr:unnamed protein product [Polarella glacialis]
MRRAALLLSPKQKRGRHPRDFVNGFYNPKLGASYMRWPFVLPYSREADSLLHYPDVSQVTGKLVDWYHDAPSDGYDGARVYGENTLELKGMPMGKTPEYMQERLRRFFSKFGPVRHCRAEPHPLDPYQCEGTAFVSFRDRSAALRALRAPLKFPASLHDKVVSMRHLDSDKVSDPDYHEKCKFWNRELLSVARALHAQLAGDPELRRDGKPLQDAGAGLYERELVAVPGGAGLTAGLGDGAHQQPPPRGRAGIPLPRGLVGAPTRLVPAGPAVGCRFGGWANFLAEPPLDELFAIETPPAGSGDGEGEAQQLVVRPRLVSSMQRARILARARIMLDRRLHEEFSVWWRAGRIPLPEYTQRRINWWDHKPTLPIDLQIMSRHTQIHKIFDERFLYKVQILKARNEKRRERRAEWAEERQKVLADRTAARRQRREEALKAVEGMGCRSLPGLSAGLASTPWSPSPRAPRSPRDYPKRPPPSPNLARPPPLP